MPTPTTTLRARRSHRQNVTAPPKVKTAIYCRISKDSTGEGLGVERQEASCRQIAAAREWDVDEAWVLVENDVSASRSKKRPLFEQLVRAMESGQVQAVIAYRLDRLVRRLDDTVRLIDIANKHGVLITTVAGDLDLTTAQGRGQTALLGVVASMEADATSERIKIRNEQARQKGRMPNGGSRAYGWQRDLKRHKPSEAKIVREMCDRLVRGESLSSIARGLNARGVPTSGGVRWDVTKVRDIAGNPRNAGYVFKGREVVYGPDGLPVMLDVKPIISVETFDEVMLALTSRSIISDKWTGVRRHLLSGTLTRCGVCGEKVFPHTQTTGVVSYRCRGHMSRNRDQTDRYVLDQVRQFALDNPIKVSGWSMEERVDLTKQVTELENRILDLEEKWVVNGGDPARLARMTARLEADLERLQAQRVDRLAQETNHRLMEAEYAQMDLTTLFEESASLLPNGDHEPGMTHREKNDADRQKETKALKILEQRTAIRMYVSKIVIHPSTVRGRRFDHDTIEIQWRDPESIRWNATIEADDE